MAAESALLAQLLGMGFELDQIEACQLALASSDTPLTLQAATDWWVAATCLATHVAGSFYEHVTHHFFVSQVATSGN